MRKKFFSAALAAVLCLASVMLLSGCDSKDKAYNYDLTEYIKVGNYKGLEYKQEKVSVSAQEVQDEITKIRQQKSTVKEIKEGTVADGDTINVSYKGKIDGKEFEGGSMDSSDITIGQTQMIDGFIEGLVGQKIGSKVKLNLKFPEDYQSAEVAGKDVVFEVKIKSKKVEKVPEYNLDFVKANSKYDSLEAYEKSIKKGLKDSKQEQADEVMKQGLWEQIVKASKVIKYPEKELNALIESTKKSMKDSVKQQNMEWEDYLKQMNTTEKEFDKTIKKFAKDRVEQDMIVYSIAKKENLSVSNKEYDKFMKDMLENAGFTESTFKDNFGTTIEQYCEDKGLRTSMLLDKVMDKVIEYGKPAK